MMTGPYPPAGQPAQDPLPPPEPAGPPLQQQWSDPTAVPPAPPPWAPADPASGVDAAPSAPGSPPPGFPPPGFPPPGFPPPGHDPAGGPPVAPGGFDTTVVAAPPKKKGVAARILSIVGLLLLIIVIAVVKVGVRDLFNSGGSSANPVVPEVKIKPANPFDRTPALLYPQGEAGILLPPATPVPGFTAAQVTAALDTVKKALVAGRLDSKMLVTHDSSAFLALFAPQGRPDVESYFTKKDFLTVATQIAPGHTLTADAVRVKGTVTFSGATEQSVRLLKVKTNFVWVYPFTGELKEPGDHLVVVHDEIEWVFPATADVEKGYQGLFLNSSQAYASNMDCDLFDASLIGLGKPKVVIGGGSTEDDNAAFDPSHTLDIKDTC